MINSKMLVLKRNVLIQRNDLKLLFAPVATPETLSTPDPNCRNLQLYSCCGLCTLPPPPSCSPCSELLSQVPTDTAGHSHKFSGRKQQKCPP